MAYCNTAPHQPVTPDGSKITHYQTEDESTVQDKPEWLAVAALENKIVAVPLSIENPKDEWKIKYSVQNKQGKHILVYNINTFDPRTLPTGHYFITGESIDRETRKCVEKVLRSIFLKKNDTVDTEFRYCWQYDTTENGRVIAISSSEFNHHMENIIVLITEDGQLIPRLIPKSMLVRGGEMVPRDPRRRRPVVEAVIRILAGIPNADLVPLPVLPNKIDKAQRKMFKDETSYEEGSEPPKNAEGSSSDEEAANPTAADPLPSSVGAAARQTPVDDSNEHSVCTAPVPYRHSLEILAVALTMVFRHRRTGCDRSNVICWMCLDVMGMFIHVLETCNCVHCPQKQLIVQALAHHVIAGHCEGIPCSIPHCKNIRVMVRDQDIRYPTPYLITMFLEIIKVSFDF